MLTLVQLCARALPLGISSRGFYFDVPLAFG